MERNEKLRKVQQQYEALKSERDDIKPQWQELSDLFMPQGGRLLGEDGKRTGRNTQLVDSTGVYALRNLAAGLFGGVTNPARLWFKLGLPDRELAQARSVSSWLEQTAQVMNDLLHRSNFYDVIQAVYMQVGCFGTGCMLVYPDEKNPKSLVFRELVAGEYVLQCDSHNRINTCAYKTQMTALQLKEKFGEENLSDQVKQALKLESSWYERFPVIHMITPRNDRNITKEDAKNMEYASYWWEEGDVEDFLRESGFVVSPAIGVRWDVVGADTYGCSPSMDALPDCRMLQAMKRSLIKALHKEVDPPMAVPSGLKKPDLAPSGINPVPTAAGGQSIYPAMQIRPNTQGTLQAVADVRDQIRRGLFNDLFQMVSQIQHTGVTATQITGMQEEKLVMLSPVLERLHSELFIPLIDYLFHHMQAVGTMPPPPQEIQGAPIKVEFVSILAKAQKQIGTAALDRFCMFIGANGQFLPELMDTVDADKLSDEYADMLGVSMDIIRDQGERDALRKSRADAQMGAEAVSQGGEMAKAAKTLSETTIEDAEHNMLASVLGGTGVLPSQ